MSPAFWNQLDHVARHLVPFACTILLLILSLVPLRLPFLPPISSNLMLISIYFWAVHRPGVLPAWSVFVIGLMADLLGGDHLGLNALLLVLAYGATTSIRRWLIGGSFAIVWWGYALLSAGTLFLGWLLNWILSGTPAAIGPGVSGLLFGVGIYPIVITLFARLQRLLLREARL